MAQTSILKAEKRSETGTSAVKKLRDQGRIPAVVYGANKEAEPLSVQEKELVTLLHAAGAGSTLVDLEVTGAKMKRRMALIQDIQQNPLTGKLLHVDFHSVREDEMVHSNVAVELRGEPIGVKHGGVLEQQLITLDIECLPRELPETITADISELEIGDALLVRDLTVPENVNVLSPPDNRVASVSEPAKMEEEEVAEEEELEEGAEEGEESEEAAPAED